MQEETSRASLSMMMPRDQTVSSWYTWSLPDIVYRRQDTAHGRHVAAHVKGDCRLCLGRGCAGPGCVGSEAGWEREGRRGGRAAAEGRRGGDLADVELD